MIQFKINNKYIRFSISFGKIAEQCNKTSLPNRGVRNIFRKQKKTNVYSKTYKVNSKAYFDKDFDKNPNDTPPTTYRL